MTVRFGESIKVELYGTSHGPCIGVRIEGLPAGRSIDVDRLQSFLDRRAPGRNAWSTSRKEPDRPVFVAGTERIGGGGLRMEKTGQGMAASRDEGGGDLPSDRILLTDGEPLVAEIPNTNVRSGDYRNTSLVPRPGHADFPSWVKYGEIQPGGGPFSARLTAALCLAGGILLQWLEDAGIRISAHIRSIGFIEDIPFDPAAGNVFVIDREFPVIDLRQGEAMKELIADVKAAGDSIGGSVECMITGLDAGLGQPLFGSIESRICQAVFAVPAVKGIEFGAGFEVCRMKGSENNDAFALDEEQRILTRTNHHGGILGGLSSGMPIVFRAAMKPTPSIALEQDSVDLKEMKETRLQVKGRHDPCIVPRAVPCIEAAAALAIGDLCLQEKIL